jgi:hypothetical protein
MTNHRTFRARPLRAGAVALAIVVTSWLWAAAPASAVPSTCNDTSTFHACIQVDLVGVQPGGTEWTVQAGVDVRLPEQYAREIVACGNSNFQASMWGEDSGNDDDFLRNLVIQPGWPSAWNQGLSASFIGLNVRDSELNEDDGEDDIYARISFLDCHTGLTRNFKTGVIHGLF